jgi:hypothetical protein
MSPSSANQTQQAMTTNKQQLESDLEVLRAAERMPVLDNDYARNTLRPVLRRYSTLGLSLDALRARLERECAANTSTAQARG